MYTVLDIETNGLRFKVNVIYCLSYRILNEVGTCIAKGTLTSLDEIKSFLSNQTIIVGHNIARYDIPVLEEMLNISLQDKVLYDTLGISYYLYPYKEVHGLDAWGNAVGVAKPKISDWENLSIEDYTHRCETDVEINHIIFVEFMVYLREIYNGDMEAIDNLIRYLSFKLSCLRDQEDVGITLNVDKVKKHLVDLTPIYEEKFNKLSSLMPLEGTKLLKSKPAKMFKMDGSLSAIGVKWLQYLEDHNLPPDTQEHRERPNPGSNVQLKNWLFSLGWQPITFKESKAKLKEGETKRALVPQISLPFGAGLCSSVKDLFPDNPGLEELDGFFKVIHRMGLFNSYLDNLREDGKVVASATGFTNTLRLTHSKPVVNLPKPGVFYGTECREVLEIPDDSYIMMGADLSGLEDNTKQHYIYFHDPEYVKEMRVPGFDAHIDIGKLAGFITPEEELFFRKVEAMSREEKDVMSDEDKALYGSIKKRRATAKSTNFAATYGAGGPKIADTAKVSIKEGYELHSIYWERNWAVKKTAEDCFVKQVRHQKWLYNPISGLYLYLKSEKDRFSLLNQNTGVFVFDTWVRIVRQKLRYLGIKICLQYHDEILLYFKKELLPEVEAHVRQAIKEVNEFLRLNIEITCSVDVGTNYAECH